MPNHKSCAKRVKTSANERMRNRMFRSELRQVIKSLREETNPEEARKILVKATSMLDRAAGRNLIHRRNADRNKSRLTLMVQKLA